MRCPICHIAVADDGAEYPFCSQRCRTIDLGRWASGAYRVPGPPVDPEDISGESDESPTKSS